jgi:aldehyde dehydrogenase (NAD+)
MSFRSLGDVSNSGLLIGDRRIKDASGGSYPHRYPATAAITSQVPLAGALEIDEAVAAARAALDVWRAIPANRRRAMMGRLADLIRADSDALARLVTVENGTPAAFAAGSPRDAAEFWDYNAGWADKIGGEVITTWPAPGFDYTTSEPYGVVGVIVPWNGPLIALSQVLAPALAAGNTIVAKPPELAPYSALRMGELVLEAGFPPGVVNVVPGGPEGGAALVRHRGINKIHFTGSGATARHILGAAAENLTPAALELGGKSANIIFAEADLAPAVDWAVGAVSTLAGQVCLLGTRVLVQSAIYDDVVDQIAVRVAAIQPGDPLDPTTRMGPVISEPACDRILGMIERAKGSADLVVGGDRLGGELADGYFVAPTVFANVDNSTELAQQEVFGPVLAIERFETEAEAVALANASEFGLAGYVHTRDAQQARRVADALEVGNVWINGFAGKPVSIPYGAVKRSGYGRLGGRAGVQEFLQPKNVWSA